MISLIPYVRETFRRHLSEKQAVMLIEFDKLKRVRDIPISMQCLAKICELQDYQEHQNEIHAKLIAIMGDRLSAHIKSLQVCHVSSHMRNNASEYVLGGKLGRSKAGWCCQ